MYYGLREIKNLNLTKDQRKEGSHLTHDLQRKLHSCLLFERLYILNILACFIDLGDLSNVHLRHCKKQT